MTRKINIRVKTGCAEQKIEDFGDKRYLVYLTERAEDNKANIELLNLMAKKFGVPAVKIKIISGLTSRDKTLEILY